MKKRKQPNADDDTNEISPEQRAAMQGTNGCVKWDVKYMPLRKTSESQHEKKEKMKGMSGKADTNPEEVKDLMKLTSGHSCWMSMAWKFISRN